MIDLSTDHILVYFQLSTTQKIRYKLPHELHNFLHTSIANPHNIYIHKNKDNGQDTL